MNGTPINVPPHDGDEAFALGARWNEPHYTWYVPTGLDLANFKRWLSQDPSTPKLVVELVPSTCWCSNVRDHVTTDVWRDICRVVYKAANYRCEVCGGYGEAHPVEGHEQFSYVNRVQTLDRIIALCPSCHLCKHPGFAATKGRTPEVYEQLMRVNKWTYAEADAHLRHAFKIWERRSQHPWHLDLAYLAIHFGIEVSEKR